MIGKFSVENINKAAKGIEKIDVKFEMDANGLLKVTATSLSSGNSEELTVRSDTMNLPKEQI